MRREITLKTNKKQSGILARHISLIAEIRMLLRQSAWFYSLCFIHELHELTRIKGASCRWLSMVACHSDQIR